MKNILSVTAFIFCLSTTLSAQWSQQPTNVLSNLFGVRFTSPMTGWIVGQNGTFLKTTDGGASWNQLTSPPAANLNKVFFSDGLNGWIVGDYNVILSTTDGGVSWYQNNDNTAYMADYYGITVRVFGNQKVCWIAGGRSYTSLSVIEESNGDGVWNPQIIGFAGRMVRVNFLTNSLGWAVGDSGLILSTRNGGIWWNQQSSQTYTGLNDIMFFDSLEGLCVGDKGLIMKSTDGGANWRVIQSNPGSIFFKLFLQGDSVAYAVGGPTNAILKSTDRGNTWTSQSVSGPAGTIFEDVYFVNDSEGWAVGNNGVVVHTTDGGVTSVNSQDPTKSYDFNLKQNYPNPFNPMTVISYSLQQEAFVTIKIYDELGREMKTLISERQNAGDHSVNFDAGTLPSGVYFYKLQAGTYTATKKLMLLK